MPPSPQGSPRITSALFYDDPAGALRFLTRAFGFEVRLKVTDSSGRLEHAELALADGLVMIGATAGRADDPKQPWRSRQRSPQGLGGANTQGLQVYVDDLDAHCARARSEGAMVLQEPQTADHASRADRRYAALDHEGHLWWFAQRPRG